MTTDKQIGTMVKKQGRLTIFASYFLVQEKLRYDESGGKG